MAYDIRHEMVALLPRLRRFAFSITGSQQEADDLVQTACERALGRLDQFAPGSRLDSWMFRIIQTAWIDQRRYQARRKQVTDRSVVDGIAFDARIYERVEAKESLAAIRNEVGRLSDDQRMVLALVVIEGLSYQEAADLLGVKIGTVMSRLARAREKLSRLISEARREPDDCKT